MINRIIRGLNCEGKQVNGKVLAIVQLDGTSHYQIQVKVEQEQNPNLDLIPVATATYIYPEKLNSNF